MSHLFPQLGHDLYEHTPSPADYQIVDPRRDWGVRPRGIAYSPSSSRADPAPLVDPIPPVDLRNDPVIIAASRLQEDLWRYMLRVLERAGSLSMSEYLKYCEESGIAKQEALATWQLLLESGQIRMSHDFKIVSRS